MPEYAEYIEELRASGQAVNTGDNTCITPTAGTRLRCFYLSYNPYTPVEAAFKFAAGGTLFLKNNVNGLSVIAKDSNAFRFIQGAKDEALILNLSVGATVNWNVFYIEIPVP